MSEQAQPGGEAYVKGAMSALAVLAQTKCAVRPARGVFEEYAGAFAEALAGAGSWSLFWGEGSTPGGHSGRQQAQTPAGTGAAPCSGVVRSL